MEISAVTMQDGNGFQEVEQMQVTTEGEYAAQEAPAADLGWL